MAEFSKEYLDTIDTNMIPDFSYLDLLKRYPKKTELSRICEGFGSVGVMRKNNFLYLLFINSEPKLLDDFTKKHEN